MPARPTISRLSGWPCSCSRPWPSSCMQACHGSKACCEKACGNSANPKLSANSEDVMHRRKFLQSTATLGATVGLTLAAPPFIAGPEHNAFAKAKGAELRAVVHCVDRGNVYLCAAKGQDPKDQDWSAYMKGKTIAVGPYGGTPNSIMRYLLGKWKLDAKRD